MFPAVHWPDPPPEVELAPYDLHVWSAILDVSAQQEERFWRLLAPEEQDRARRFHFEHDKTHFVAARGILRTLIGRYLACSPDVVRFTYGKYGKPALLHPSTTETFQFNVTHTQGTALFAFCWGSPVGVDVEQLRPLSDTHQIAARYFSNDENKHFNTLPAAQTNEGFFNCWTRKEAFIKAVGDGLSYPLNQFDVTLRPGDAARFVHIRGSKTEASRWSLYALTPRPGYVGAVAVPGRNWHLSCWQWPPS
jgi:4'-phosphopantetheinyl transferase